MRQCCIACGTELVAARARVPHTVYVKIAVPHRRPGLLPPPHHQGRRGRRRHRRGQGRRRAGYGGSRGMNLPGTTEISWNRPADAGILHRPRVSATSLNCSLPKSQEHVIS